MDHHDDHDDKKGTKTESINKKTQRIIEQRMKTSSTNYNAKLNQHWNISNHHHDDR